MITTMQSKLLFFEWKDLEYAIRKREQLEWNVVIVHQDKKHVTKKKDNNHAQKSQQSSNSFNFNREVISWIETEIAKSIKNAKDEAEVEKAKDESEMKQINEKEKERINDE
eukprot:510519_1